MAITETITHRVTRTMKGTIITVSIIGIILGIIALVWPGASLLTIAILFGSYLIVAGAFRVSAALSADSLSPGFRWLLGSLGVLVIVAGIFCLANPFGTLLILALVIGIGWVLDGLADITAGAMGMTRGPTWLAIVSGLVSIGAGIVVFLLPGLAIATFVMFGAILLIIVSATNLLTLPLRARNGHL